MATGVSIPRMSGDLIAMRSLNRSLSCVAGGTSASRRCCSHACSLRSMRSRVADAVQATTAASTAAAMTMTAAILPRLQVPLCSARVSIDPRHRETIDERDSEVHHEHCERNSVRVTAPGAYDVSDEADPCAIDQLALLARGRRNGIGCDEERTEHRGSSGQMEHGSR